VAEVGKVAGGERAGETVVRIDPKYFRPAEARPPAQAGLRQSRRSWERGCPGVSARAVAVDRACARPALGCNAGVSAYAFAVKGACSRPTLECGVACAGHSVQGSCHNRRGHRGMKVEHACAAASAWWHCRAAWLALVG